MFSTKTMELTWNFHHFLFAGECSRNESWVEREHFEPNLHFSGCNSSMNATLFELMENAIMWKMWEVQESLDFWD